VLELVKLTERKGLPVQHLFAGDEAKTGGASCLLGNPQVLVSTSRLRAGPCRSRRDEGSDPATGPGRQDHCSGQSPAGRIEKSVRMSPYSSGAKLLDSGNVNEVLVNEDFIEVGAESAQRRVCRGC